MRIVLESFTDENGSLGLGIVGMPRDESTNAATDGLLVAHDIMEHVNGPSKIGTIDDELEALGAIWYVRGQHGQLRRDSMGSMYTIAQNVAADITRMFRDYYYGTHVNMETLRTRPVLHDDDLQDTLNAADDSYLREFDSDETTDIINNNKWFPYRTLCLHRMRVGYRKAARKWEKHGQYAANNMFWEIADAVQSVIDSNVEVDGQRFTLKYGYGIEVTCTENYDDNY